MSGDGWILGRGFELKNDKKIIAIRKFDVQIYMDMEFTFPKKIWGDLPSGVGLLNICDPLYSSNFFSFNL